MDSQNSLNTYRKKLENTIVFFTKEIYPFANSIVSCSPSQLYLVLDVTNLTPEEMDFHYAPSKHILIESKESCRVPVPLDRCPFNSTPSKPIDEGK